MRKAPYLYEHTLHPYLTTPQLPHSGQVVEGLRRVTRLLCSEEEAPYLYVHMNGGFDLLMR